MVRKMINNVFKQAFIINNRSIIVNTSQLAFTSSGIIIFIILSCNISTKYKVYQLPIQDLSVTPQYPITIPLVSPEYPFNVHSMSTQRSITHPSTRIHKTVLTTICSQTLMDACKSLFTYNSVYESTIIIHYNMHTHSKSHKTSEKVLWHPTSVVWCCMRDIIDCKLNEIDGIIIEMNVYGIIDYKLDQYGQLHQIVDKTDNFDIFIIIMNAIDINAHQIEFLIVIYIIIVVIFLLIVIHVTFIVICVFNLYSNATDLC